MRLAMRQPRDQEGHEDAQPHPQPHLKPQEQHQPSAGGKAESSDPETAVLSDSKMEVSGEDLTPLSS